ncbi:hypothetical protein EV421DRAFT_2025930 [Armillaria borealis]|uniref:Uncharacterized protein n=1 Tax=Armillaria borealis TaxID=47425 RepID=A0AA39IUT8_9AGAR|nr:hypothetical protein EV421DRAFT_2025930 [Armillaria borealis]
MTVTLFPSYHTIEVALEEEELSFHPFFDAYHNALPSTTANNQDMIYNAQREWRVVLALLVASAHSTSVHAVLRLWPLGWEPPLYGAKQRDEDDGIRGIGRRSTLFERMLQAYRGRHRGTEFAKTADNGLYVPVNFEPISSSETFYNATALEHASAAITQSTNVDDDLNPARRDAFTVQKTNSGENDPKGNIPEENCCPSVWVNLFRVSDNILQGEPRLMIGVAGAFRAIK